MKVKRTIKIKTDHFLVGDVIKFRLSDGEKVQAMAVQQEDDGMLFCLVDCLDAEYPMNDTNAKKGGYEDSALRIPNATKMTAALTTGSMMYC